MVKFGRIRNVEAGTSEAHHWLNSSGPPKSPCRPLALKDVFGDECQEVATGFPDLQIYTADKAIIDGLMHGRRQYRVSHQPVEGATGGTGGHPMHRASQATTAAISRVRWASSALLTEAGIIFQTHRICVRPSWILGLPAHKITGL